MFKTIIFYRFLGYSLQHSSFTSATFLLFKRHPSSSLSTHVHIRHYIDPLRAQSSQTPLQSAKYRRREFVFARHACSLIAYNKFWTFALLFHRSECLLVKNVVFIFSILSPSDVCVIVIVVIVNDVVTIQVSICLCSTSFMKLYHSAFMVEYIPVYSYIITDTVDCRMYS